ncbi:FecR family protein [Dyadobacter sp. LHD-138]|uniref:FecR family protein n=1 Tax=Dyadobacter sp. LHD-138 TaxID=3071413 RepID=UPI0027DF8651|nr:FecR family protein [Dyadobacter sp. LHD-138]MDQ6479463.1 FecR family protein [Dyadobacter sp. LHD-138]
MDNNEFRLPDFLNNDSFVQWVLFRTEDGHWQQVQADYPGIKPVMKQAREIIMQLRAEEEEAVSVDEEKVLDRILAKIESSENVFGIPPEKRSSMTWLKWAAVVLFFLGTGWFLINKNLMQAINYNELVARAAEQNTLIEKINSTDVPMRIAFEDGTVVTLKKNSRLSYPVHFKEDIREVFLSGEAFFEVAKNPKKPFFVYANEVVTRVLGTSFDIKAFDGERQVRVNVRTGQVSVYNQKRISLVNEEVKGLVLSPNQQAVFDRKNESLSKHLSDDPIPLLAEAGDVKKLFDDIPVSQIFQELEALYGIRIIYNKEILSNCIISTRFGHDSLNDKLDVICQTIGATHKEIDAQIIIESAGCQ